MLLLLLLDVHILQQGHLLFAHCQSVTNLQFGLITVSFGLCNSNATQLISEKLGNGWDVFVPINFSPKLFFLHYMQAQPCCQSPKASHLVVLCLLGLLKQGPGIFQYGPGPVSGYRLKQQRKTMQKQQVL